MSAGRHRVAMSWAKRMAALAAASERKNVKQDLQIVACRAKMTSFFWMGDLAAATREAGRIESEYRAAAHGHIAEQTNTDPLTAEGIYRSQILWMLGFPDQAIAKSDAKDEHARSREHPHPIDLGLALTLGASVFDYCGQAADLLARGRQAEALGQEHRVKLIEEKMAPIVIGVASLRAGNYAESVDQIGNALSKLTETGHGAWVPYVRALLGEARARSGDVAGGLACIEQSLEQIERQEERVHLSEVLRLKGWMRMQQGRSEEAEACLREAIDVARRQQAKSWELRAATTLARVLGDRGDRAGAYQLLRPAYDWFKEGFGTKDLKDAKVLLDELES
jgi:tetratricopeptide (TPR) repeat protein